MATTKITITVDDEQLRQIRTLVVEGSAANTSAFIKHAIGVALSDAAGWSEMLTEGLRQTGGPLTKRERAWADTILGRSKPQPAKKRKVA